VCIVCLAWRSKTAKDSKRDDHADVINRIGDRVVTDSGVIGENRVRASR